MRRAVVKVHIARAGKGIGNAAFKAHLKYIQRDGVDRLGDAGKSLGGDLYNEASEKLDDKDFLTRSEDGRHQFRVILSPEDGDKLGDLKANTRAFMARMEKDLGTRLDWVAVDHYNTGHPHTHIVIRGKDERGKDLVIAREYLTKGMRRAASELITERWGPRRDLEIARSQASDVTKDRLTGIDRRLEAAIDDDALTIGGANTAYDRFERSLRLQRLSHLQSLGLISKDGNAVWRFEREWQAPLKALGKRGDVIRTLAAIEGASRDVSMLDASDVRQKPIIRRVLTSKAEDELRDTRALIIEGIDGKTWHVPIGPQIPGALPPKGAIIEAAPIRPEPRASDRTIANIAAVNGGIYSEALHGADDPAASGDYKRAHARRLEALRRSGIVQRFSDGQWAIPDDFLERAAAFEAEKPKGAAILVKSWVDIDDQITARDPAWLDEVDEGAQSKAGFGKEVKQARTDRRAHIAAAKMTPNEADALNAAADHLAGKGHGAFRETVAGERFEGVYEKPVDLAHGRFALIAWSKEFTLVPWRPELEKARGAALTIKRTGKGVQWTLGKSRGIGR